MKKIWSLSLFLLLLVTVPSYAQNDIRLTEIKTLGRGSIQDIAWSGDGTYLAVASSTGIYIHSASNWEQAPQKITQQASYQVEWQNNQLIALTDRNELRRWEINPDGAHILSITQPLSAWIRDQKIEVVITEDDIILVRQFDYGYQAGTCTDCAWSIAKNNPLEKDVDFEILTDEYDRPLVLFFRNFPRGIFVATFFEQGEYFQDINGNILSLGWAGKLTNLTNNQLIYDLDAGYNIRLSPQHTYILFMTDRGTLTDSFLHLYGFTTGELVLDLQGRLSSRVRFAEFTADDQHLAASDGATLIIWDLVTGAIEGQIAGYGGEVTEITVSPGGDYFVSSHSQNLESRASQIWSFAEDNSLGTFIGTAPYAWLEDNALFAGTFWFIDGGNDYFFSMLSFASAWDLSDLQHPIELDFPIEFAEEISSAAYIKDEHTLILSQGLYYDRSILILDYPSFRPKVVNSFVETTYHFAVSPDENYMAFDMSSSGLIGLTKLDDIFENPTLERDTMNELIFWRGGAFEYTFSPNSDYLVTSTWLAFENSYRKERRQEELTIYSLADSNIESIFTQNFYDLHITNLVFSPDNQYLAMTGQIYTYEAHGEIYFYLFDTTTWQIIYRKQFTSERMNTLTFTPDGRYLLEGTQDGLIHIWELGN